MQAGVDLTEYHVARAKAGPLPAEGSEEGDAVHNPLQHVDHRV
jgi:hypothetical protein